MERANRRPTKALFSRLPERTMSSRISERFKDAKRDSMPAVRLSTRCSCSNVAAGHGTQEGTREWLRKETYQNGTVIEQLGEHNRPSRQAQVLFELLEVDLLAQLELANEAAPLECQRACCFLLAPACVLMA